jgi:hypothetical protein
MSCIFVHLNNIWHEIYGMSRRLKVAISHSLRISSGVEYSKCSLNTLPTSSSSTTPIFQRGGFKIEAELPHVASRNILKHICRATLTRYTRHLGLLATSAPKRCVSCSPPSHRMEETKQIDGSTLEGGGQILRNAAALSTLLGQSVIVNNIRKGRKVPGMKAQHAAGTLLYLPHMKFESIPV